MELDEQHVKRSMKEVIEHLQKELKSLRSGRANASVLDKVRVEAYGSLVSLKEVATLSVPEARQIVVTPFDPGILHAIKKGIETANLGLNPIIDGKVVRVPIPPMDEAVRKQIAKQCKDLGEKYKVSIREVRRKYNEQARKQKGEWTEDQIKRLEKKIQEYTDQFCKEVDTVVHDKEKEVLTI
jgi:ribosome recycling factor